MSDIPPPPAAPTPKGKIGRLPARIREAVNRRLHDGETAGQILPWLNALPEVVKVLELHFSGEAVSPQNLSAWRAAGFQAWLAQREEIESTKSLAKFAADLAAAAGTDLGSAAKAVAAGKILARLQGVGDDAEIETLLDLTKAAVKLHGGDIDTVKLKQAQHALDQRERDLTLREHKYQRDTADLFLKWHADLRAREIAESKADRTVKMDQLVQLIFGERPATPAA
jgi:hypothetical protein